MEIIMPKMGESINEGTIIKWYKKVGDTVQQDEIIFEISTDKVDTEIPSPASGVLKEIKFNENDTVEVGKVVAIIDSSNDGSHQVEETNTQEIQTKIEPEQKEEDTKETVAKVKSEEPNGKLINIEMPKMGESVMEGTIIKWYKKVGEKVSKDETIFEISTDKVDTEIPSPVDGRLAEILIGEQETADVGTVVAKISTDSDTVTSSDVKEESEINEETTAPAAMHDNFSQAKVEREKPKGEGAQFFSPLVLNIAQKENVSFDELENIDGSGLNGRITKKDILNYIKERGTKKFSTDKLKEQKKDTAAIAPETSFAASKEQIQSSVEDVEKIPMDNIRQKIMEHMVASRDTSVHVTSMIEVDMTRIHNFIRDNKEQLQQKDGVKLTYMAFIAQACVKAIKAYPLINSTLDGNTIIKKKYVNLGIAVAIEPTGLIVPNIKGADQLNLFGLVKAVNEVAYKSRNKKLSPDDISGGTFTITNYGVFGTVFGTPIINQPEVAILGVGAVLKKPVVISVDGADAIAIKPVVALTLSHDHRLVDGMLGGLFLKYLKETLEGFDPESV
ncbi:MAG: 2-oxoglutarate dehydrogenase, E2 component, dihydrolipoamide succinyltransferase [Ignavibacteria bacterium]|nr:2-oxoglutarate dehydrogenase, E2 component, dihydrolipoamide succinyltransferase [Ignavibacteria bacterium]MBT8381410.1 2-oxoglutarate dehydrogenase, E2 component, dihydrolipoamide succinyltransferase [Ignavibacteria bacterium]MBT8392522.1 2-oxoglutarate dehydrogenase, E2 component, dihydrolipoamide succinyltransferase [Ignavibacteria bacterium]NNL21293.1 2-oxoglutarate dehydrogenase, E2 component, dihydrolipoamide succinyltransferase [Ignavibacteriaceae bacterium]